MKISSVKNDTLLKGINEILPLFSAFIWVKFNVGFLHKNLLSYYKFHENRCSESHTLLKGINEFVCILCTYAVQFW